MKFRELLDKVVLVLYELKSERGMGYYNLNKIIEKIGYPSDLSEMNKLAKYLEAKGYIKIKPEFGTIFAKITHAGLVYVEDNNLTLNKLEIHFNVDDAPIYNEDEVDYLKFRQPLLDIIKRMKNLLTKNKKGKTDVGKDVDILKLEMSKINPNNEIIEFKLRDLENEKLLRNRVEEIREALDI